MVLSCNATILLRQTLFFKYFMCFSLTYFRFENLYQIGDGAGRKSQSPGGHATLSLPLRFAAKILYELCLGVFLCLTKLAFMRRPWLGISVFHGIISTVSKPLRYSLTGSMCDALQAATCGTYSLLKLRYFIVASVSGSQHTGYGLSASL